MSVLAIKHASLGCSGSGVVRTTKELEMSRNCKHIEIMLLVIMFQQTVWKSGGASGATKSFLFNHKTWTEKSFVFSQSPLKLILHYTPAMDYWQIGLICHSV